MSKKRIVLIGGPGSGKTSIIQHLEQSGYSCMHEISREVTKKAQADGIDQLFLEQPLLFSELLLEGRLAQFHNAKELEAACVFYDRGLPDVTIYMDFIGSEYGDDFKETCYTHRYDAVFLLPPWKDIYEQDNERYESFEQATELYAFLKRGYQEYHYRITEVPIGTVEERAAFILTNSNLI